MKRLFRPYSLLKAFCWRFFDSLKLWFGILLIAWSSFALLLVFVFVQPVQAAPQYIFTLENGGDTINGLSPTLFRGIAGECLTQASVKQVAYNWNDGDAVYYLAPEEPNTDAFSITITGTKGNTSTAVLADVQGNNCLANPAGGDIGVPSRDITINDNGLTPKTKTTAAQGTYTFISNNEIEATNYSCAITNGVKSGVADFTYDNDGTAYAYTWHPTGVTYNGQITNILLKSKNKNGSTTYTGLLADSCDPNGTTITITAPAGKNITPQSTVPPPPGVGTGVPPTPQLTCSAGWNPFNWLLCAMVTGLVNIASALDNLINNLLSVGTGTNPTCNGTPTAIFGGNSAGCANSNTAADYQAAWASFRDIALGLLVVACLVVVVSTALGFEVLDAYTIRKMLPRIIIVAIAITLSWDLMDFFVQLTNDLGYGIRYLIYKPFEGLHLTLNLGGGGSVAVTLIGSLAITALGIFGLFLFALTAALSLFTAFFVMILRQILITVLIIVAPVAIVCYILPNTQRIYSLWWNLFARALLMFPLVAGVIAAGRVFAAVAAQNPNPIDQIIAFGAYFGVFLLVPKMWSYGGVALAAAGNAVNRAASGSQRGLAKKRGEVMSSNIKKARAGQRWNENFGSWTNPLTGKRHKGIGHYANRFAVNAFDQDELSRYRAGKYKVPGFVRYHAKIQDELDDAAMSQSIEGYKHIEQEGGMHPEGWRALTGTGMNDFDAATVDKLKVAGRREGYYNEKTGQFDKPTSLKQLESVAEIMQQSSDDRTRLGGVDLQNNAGYLSTVKSHQGMEYANVQAMAALGLSAEGEASPEQLAVLGNSISEDRHGGAGVAQRVVKQAQKVGSGKRPEIRQGHGVIVNTDHATGKVSFSSAFERDASGQLVNESTALGNVLSIKSGEWSGAKAESIDAMHDTLVDVAAYGHRGVASETDRDRLEQGRQMREMISYQAGMYGPTEADARRRWAQLEDQIGRVAPTAPPTMSSSRQAGFNPNAGPGMGATAGTAGQVNLPQPPTTGGTP